MNEPPGELIITLILIQQVSISNRLLGDAHAIGLQTSLLNRKALSHQLSYLVQVTPAVHTAARVMFSKCESSEASH